MSKFLITQTPFSDVRPIDPSVRLTGTRLCNILKRHLDPDTLAQVTQMFADPEPVEGAAATDWYTDYDATPVRASDLDEADRDSVLADVGGMCAQIAQISDTIEADAPGNTDAAYLRAAIAIPDNNQYIYAFDGQPVIVAWGHKLAGAGKAPVPAGIWVSAAAPETDGTDDTDTTADGHDAQEYNTATVLTSSGVVAPAGVGWLAWLLWTIFLLQLLAILWVVLSACSMGGPQSSLAQRLGFLNRCPAPVQVVQAPVLEQSGRADALRQAIRDAELALAENAQQCRVVRRAEDDTRRALLEQSRTPDPNPTPEPEQTLADEADDRVREAGGQTGEMQVVLQWDGPADLDMSVSCGGGSISYNNRASCNGGELDVDANYEIHMDRPVENIHWAEMPPSGSYELNVRNHQNQGDPRAQIPFTVLVRQGDQEQTYNGNVAPGRAVSVTNIVVD